MVKCVISSPYGMHLSVYNCIEPGGPQSVHLGNDTTAETATRGERLPGPAKWVSVLRLGPVCLTHP